MTDAGDDRALALLASLVTPDVLRMQTRLYRPHTRPMAPVSDSNLWRLLRELRASFGFDPFRIWLVGSRVEGGREESDIDLVLGPRAGFSPTDEIIEQALWYCRNHGLYAATPAGIVDPCFRAGGPSLDVVALQPDTVMTSIKLFSPKLMHEVLAGRISEYRRLGRFAIEYRRRAKDTDYYRKLPLRSFDGLTSPYLRPAIEVL